MELGRFIHTGKCKLSFHRSFCRELFVEPKGHGPAQKECHNHNTQRNEECINGIDSSNISTLRANCTKYSRLSATITNDTTYHSHKNQRSDSSNNKPHNR